MTTARHSDQSPEPPAPVPQWLDREDSAHVVQFYSDDAFFLSASARFVEAALRAGDGAVALATPEHLEALAQRMTVNGLDVAAAGRQGRYVALDAHEALRKFMVDGWPDATRFAQTVGHSIEQARASTPGRRTRVAAFGEMVAILCAEGKVDAAVRLEELWNDLSHTCDFSLLCAYPMAGFDHSEQTESFRKICAAHTAVVPTENYSALGTDEHRLRSIAGLQQKAQTLEPEIARRERQEKFRRDIESVQDYAIYLLDIEGYVVTWNSGGQRIKGYSADEIIGQHFSAFYPPDARVAGQPELALATAAQQGRFEEEGWRLRKDGNRFWANVVITPSRDGNGQLTGFIKITRDTTTRALRDQALTQANEDLRREVAARVSAERRLQASEESLRRLSAHLFRTQEDERRSLGRDLHDNVGQYLAALKMNLETLAGGPVPVAECESQIRECVNMAERSIHEVRTMSYLLYPPDARRNGLAIRDSPIFGRFHQAQPHSDHVSDVSRLRAAGPRYRNCDFPRAAGKPDQRAPAFRESHGAGAHPRRRRDGSPGSQGPG